MVGTFHQNSTAKRDEETRSFAAWKQEVARSSSVTQQTTERPNILRILSNSIIPVTCQILLPNSEMRCFTSWHSTNPSETYQGKKPRARAFPSEAVHCKGLLRRPPLPGRFRSSSARRLLPVVGSHLCFRAPVEPLQTGGACTGNQGTRARRPVELVEIL